MRRTIDKQIICDLSGYKKWSKETTTMIVARVNVIMVHATSCYYCDLQRTYPCILIMLALECAKIYNIHTPNLYRSRRKQHTTSSYESWHHYYYTTLLGKKEIILRHLTSKRFRIANDCTNSKRKKYACSISHEIFVLHAYNHHVHS